MIKPLAGYVLIEPAPKETKTASGIVLPESAEEKPQEGKAGPTPRKKAKPSNARSKWEIRLFTKNGAVMKSRLKARNYF